MNTLTALQVIVTGPERQTSSIIQIAGVRQDCYAFVANNTGAYLRTGSEYEVVLRLDPKPHPLPYRVATDRSVVVSTWQSAAISRYLNIRTPDYLLVCAMAGLTQWRAMQMNPLIRPEDFRHEPSNHCIFSTVTSVQEFVLLLEHSRICPGCHDFYHWLGADSELLAMRSLLDRIQNDMGLDRWMKKAQTES